MAVQSAGTQVRPRRVVAENVRDNPAWVDVRTVDSMLLARKAMV